MKHIKKSKECFCQKGQNEGKSQKVSLKKSQKLLAENRHERPPIQNIL